MKKTLLFTGAALVISSAVFAGPGKKDKKATAPTEIKCAVMSGRTVNIKEATEHKMFADYKGNRYFFCCGGCPGQFKADPAKFATAAHIPTPKAGKKG